MRIGIFFGGPSREREVSFAGGRTVYDNLDKNLFEPVPIFVDSLGHFILLRWEFLYKGTIRDFYPPAQFTFWEGKRSPFQVYIESLGELPAAELEAIIAQVGQVIYPHQFKKYFDFAFLALHGPFGEDGNIQGLLEWYGLPYSGSGILPSAIGVNKIAQGQLLRQAGFRRPRQKVLTTSAWQKADKVSLLAELAQEIGLPLVIKAPNQGSSIGVSILSQSDPVAFTRLGQKAFFQQEIGAAQWKAWSEAEKIAWLLQFTDLREGLGFPVAVHDESGQLLQIVHRPEVLRAFLEETFRKLHTTLLLEAQAGEKSILLEEFIVGKEFSCIVIRGGEGQPLALPPTEIRKFNQVFDYRSKYLPGTSRKVTPIEESPATIEAIRQACCQLFEAIYGEVYARIDGFLTPEGHIYLNDPNTTSGMMPSSFFFHQAAEIGLNASQFLTYLIETSLKERLQSGKNAWAAQNGLRHLHQQRQAMQSHQAKKIRVAVVMGGFSSERHISMESGRNIYEKLASSAKYAPFPVFLTGSEAAHELYELPISYMLKDNADDIRDKIAHRLKQALPSEAEQLLESIREEARSLTEQYAAHTLTKPQSLSYEALRQKADVVFIALHGRPGEDGALQAELEKVGLPYNGSGIESSRITINKFETNEILQQHGVLVAQHRLVHRVDWQGREAHFLQEIEAQFAYPLIAKPADDGCSSAVKKIKNPEEMAAFARMMFRPEAAFLEAESQVLKLKNNEEFPQKAFFLIEELITAQGAAHFLEITGGLLTHYKDGQIQYEIFEPSETLAQGEVLSLEEKFLAGEGQNITPARYDRDPERNARISEKVRSELEKVARILHIEGYARIDAFVRIWSPERVELIVIEVNSLPGMTPATCIFHQSAINGYKPYHFIDAILNFAQQKVRSTLSLKEE
ncbi:MAG: hypothetical protein OHK0053_15100 [Microscillaceae bacterium]